jgi:hypothetical protein
VGAVDGKIRNGFAVISNLTSEAGRSFYISYELYSWKGI